MSSIATREQLCHRYCSNKHTPRAVNDHFCPVFINEEKELQKVCDRLFSNDAEHLHAIMGYISGVMAPVARCELLRLLTKVLDDAD